MMTTSSERPQRADLASVLVAEVAELDLALEQMADVLSEEDMAVSNYERADILDLARRIEIAERISGVLGSCPRQPSDP